MSVFGVILILRIQSECGNMRTRITPKTDTFFAVYWVPNLLLWVDIFRKCAVNWETRDLSWCSHCDGDILYLSKLSGLYFDSLWLFCFFVVLIIIFVRLFCFYWIFIFCFFICCESFFLLLQIFWLLCLF